MSIQSSGNASVIEELNVHLRTERYAASSQRLYPPIAQRFLETKRRALEQIAPSKKPSHPPRWKQNPELLAWLDSL